MSEVTPWVETHREAEIRREVGLLWFTLDDLVSGRISSLADIEVVLKLLKRHEPRARSMIDHRLVRALFARFDRATQLAVLTILAADYDKGGPR